MKNMRTIILAAGKGVRMKSATPKVLHHVCGKPIIQYVLDVARLIGSLKTYVVIGHGQTLIRNHISKDTQSIIQKKLLGTADAVKSTRRYFSGYKGDVLVLSGDSPLIESATVRKLIRRHKKKKAACTFLTSVMENPAGYGRVIRDARKSVVAIREEKDASGFEKSINEINAGAYCFKSDVLFKIIQSVKINKKKKEFYLTDVIELLSQRNARIETVTADEPSEVLGINTREDLARAEAIMRYCILEKFMTQGVTIVDPQMTYIDSSAVIGRDTTIKPYTIIESNVRIGSRCVVGPFCHIRPGTKIGNEVEIGNFTEVSRSTLGNKCFMKHFSFLGDARIGRRVNIGAGTVTANFDGKNKNRTIISDDAFIGSDSILVAPLTVGRRAITAAGCVVTKGKKIPDGSVAIGVPAKIISRRKR